MLSRVTANTALSAWYLAIALGIVAGLLNLPIDERRLQRPHLAPRPG